MAEEFDLDDLFDVPPAKAERRGGRRPGAGRKPAGYVKPPEIQDFEKARARNEAAKASMNELDFLTKSGQWVNREQVRQAAAAIMLSLAQTLRSIPDALELAGIDPSICVRVEKIINDELESAALDLEMLAGPVEVAT
jgi:phage terminase Nu1 subunit (DNA packaging protein)